MDIKTQHTTKYKNSPLGLIPEDWEVKAVAEAFEICNNLRFPINEDERKKIKGVYPYYGPTKIQDYINEYRVDGKYALIGEDGDHFLKWKELPMTLLIDGKFNVNNHAHLIQGKENLTEWFFYYFNNKELTSHLTRQGAGRYKLTKKALGEMLCPIPLIEEQKAIADCLSTWDKAIEKQEAIITQKELSKKALMQQLLLGKKRLNGFGSEWDKIKMKDIGVIPNKNPIQKLDKQKLLTVKLYVKGVEFNESATPIISKSGRPYYERRKGEILIGRQNIHNGGIGLVSEIFDGGICSNAISSFLVDESKYSKKFIFFYLSNPVNYKKIENFMGGTGQKELSEKQLLELEIRVPLLPEQVDIANVLQTADDELQILKKKLEQLKKQKKGLMQVLLTGKKRLKY